MKNLLKIFAVCLGIAIISGSALAKPPQGLGNNSDVEKSMGQTVYLPLAHMNFEFEQADGQVIYQRIFNRIMLRNTDPNNQITITSVEIYDPDGQLLVNLIEAPISLGPLASTTYGIPGNIPPNDNTVLGRHCALVKWEANNLVNHPNVGTAMAWGILEGNVWKYTAFDSIAGKIIE